MRCYAALVTLCLWGIAASQTNLVISSCLTKEQNLQMFCKFAPHPNTTLQKNCYYTADGKLVASTIGTDVPDNTFKNRANVSVIDNTCQLFLKGFSDDKPKNYSCFVKQTSTPTSLFATVDKSNLVTCSAWCVLQHSGAALLLTLLISPILTELL